jgi:tRNA G18 (ribose-2'-O)-methylase SpoU
MLNDLQLESDKKYAFVFGNEVMGVNQEVIDLCGKCLEIPQFGSKHSFNISVSIGIVLWDVLGKLGKV